MTTSDPEPGTDGRDQQSTPFRSDGGTESGASTRVGSPDPRSSPRSSRTVPSSTDRDGRSPSRLESVRTVTIASGKRGTSAVLGAVRGALAQPTTSDVATLVLTLAICLAVGGSLIGPRFAAVATVGGVGAALVATLLGSDRPVRRAVGGALAVPVAVLVAVPVTLAWAFAVGVAGFGPFTAVIVWSLVVAALAGTLASWDRLGDGGVRAAARATTLAALGVVAVVVVRVLPEAGVRERAGPAVAEVTGAASGVLREPGQTLATVSFFALVLATAGAVFVTVGYVPIERLAPPDRREAVSRAVGVVRRGNSIAIRVALVGLSGVVMLPALLEQFSDVPLSPRELSTIVPLPVGEALATVVLAREIRLVLLVVLAIAAFVAALEWTRRALRRGLAAVLARLLAPMVGGVVLTLALASVLATPAVEASLEALVRQIEPQVVADLLLEFPPIALVVAVLLVALGMLSSLFGTVSLLRAIRLLPPRAIGSALAAMAILGLAGSLAVIGRTEAAIWTAAGAFVVWDVGEYADGLRAELGRDAATMRAELVHALGAVATGAAVALGTVGLYRWAGSDVLVVDRRLAAAALGAALLAVVLVAWILRK
ncbi:DUF7519 family protein [Natronosalvus caseinilyticus]|uniref:DUF7519 family protein n=1 Tax=Natronosalvus caseinilyticus TaxID=2953747 RepID=UPI0028A5CD12|nr:hypothetical protein [Natronosalvus caseinilyticus]